MPRSTQNCIAAGAPTGPVPASTTVQLNAGGSPALQPEEGKSFTIGTVLTPAFVPRLSMTLDYYHITLTDAIGQTNLSQALQACYSDPNFLSAFCELRWTRATGTTCAIRMRRSRESTSTRSTSIVWKPKVSTTPVTIRCRAWAPVPGSLSLDVRLSYIISNFNSGSNLT